MATHSRPRRAAIRGGFSMIELLVALAIVAIMVSSLIPALAAARSSAARSSCAWVVRGNTQSILTYASDNNSIIPPINPSEGGNNTLTDYRQLNAYLASWEIWGTRTPYWMPEYATAVNEALGMGTLVVGNYNSIENMYCPTTRYEAYRQLRRSDYNYNGLNYQALSVPPLIPADSMPTTLSDFPTWSRRIFFGEPLQKPWPDKDGRPWDTTSLTSTDNRGLLATYSYRSGDYCVYNPTTNTLSAGGGGAWRGFPMLKTSREDFGRRSLVMDYIDANHIALSGVNVTFGDGSASFWSEPNMWKYFTDFRGAARGGYWGNMPNATLGVPVDATAFGSFTLGGAAFQSFAFAVADVRLRP